MGLEGERSQLRRSLGGDLVGIFSRRESRVAGGHSLLLAVVGIARWRHGVTVTDAPVVGRRLRIFLVVGGGGMETLALGPPTLRMTTMGSAHRSTHRSAHGSLEGAGSVLGG